MALKILKFKSRGPARYLLIAVAAICLVSAWFFIKWNFANAIASRLDPARPESKTVADWLTGIAPGDPQTHLAAAALFEKTFDAGDLERSLAEYERAATYAPNNYVMWLNLGRSRSLAGDDEGADAAFRRALELSPNYAAVQWVYGNFLVRQGKTAEGFALISRAAATDPAFSIPAVITASQILDGDINAIKNTLGDSDVVNAALGRVAAGQKQYGDAYTAWSALSDRSGKFKQFGETLAAEMAAEKQFHLAARVIADIGDPDVEKPVVGEIGNGGFEDGVKLRSAGIFEWKIGDGPEPQIGLSEGQKRSGKYSLWVVFDTMQTAAFRTISKTVAVVPGAEYELELFYRYDIKSAAQFHWEIADATTGTPLGKTEPLALAADWTTASARFRVPELSDGVLIQLVREGCTGPSCPVSGRISFDDFSLRRL